MEWLSLFSVVSRETMLLVISIPISLGVGFAIGLIYERWHQAGALERTSRKFEKLFEYVSGCLDQAEKAAAILESKSVTNPLSADQNKKLGSSWDRLSKRVGSLTQDKERPAKNGTSQRSGKPLGNVRFVQTPADERTGLPGRAAYESNVRKLQKAHAKSDRTSGAIFLKMDHLERLKNSHGEKVTAAFLRQLAGTAIRQLREDDVLCQLEDDLCVALLPDVKSSQLVDIVTRLRNALQNSELTHPETNASVFVTATLGCTLFSEFEVREEQWEEMLKHRCQLSLKTTQRHGRWQAREVRSDGTAHLIAT